MMLEGSDLNDGTIIHATKQEEGANDTLRFSITLPSSRKLVSEYFRRDKAKEAMFAWLETVREQAVADVQEDQLKRRRGLEKSPSQSPIESTTPKQERSEESLSDQTDAVAYATSRRDLFQRLVEHLQLTIDQMSEKLASAERDLRKWQKVVDSLIEEG